MYFTFQTESISEFIEMGVCSNLAVPFELVHLITFLCDPVHHCVPHHLCLSLQKTCFEYSLAPP